MQVITTHAGTDFDALASMVAAQKLYPEARICFPGSVSREVRQFMLLYGGLVRNTKIEEIDLNKVTRLILVDTRWINRIGIFSKLVNKKKVEIHLYDHHPSYPGDIEGDWGICKKVGATVSILISLIRERGDFITPPEASLFMLGIYEDTGSLIFSSTTPFDFKIASFLLSRGANLEFISGFLNRKLTDKQISLFNDFLKKAKIWIINGVEVVVIVTEIDKFIGGLSLPLRKFIDLKNLEVVFALIKAKEKIYLIARSRTPSINVSGILSFFGGGGHSFAASAIIKGNKSLIDVEKQLHKILNKNTKPLFTVGKVMRGIPLKEIKKIMRTNKVALNSSISLKRAQEIMLEKHSKKAVIFKENKPVGVISGDNLLSAFHQQKKNSENLEQLLEKAIPRKVQKLLRQAGKIAEELGYRAFIVGGIVRDILLGIENLDIDLVIEGDGILFSAQFAKKVGGELRKYKEFGTATITFPDGFKLDIATSREEFYSEPASLPQVKPAPLQKDLFRRDFTVNSLAIDLSPSNFGFLTDFFEGEKDLREKKVRVLHSRSFIEDPTRIFRAIRFEQRYGFIIEEKTQKLIEEALRGEIFQKLSKERIREELIQILEEDRPEKSIRRMQEFGILKAIYPELELTSREEKILDNLIDVFAWFEVLFEEKVKRWLIRLLVILENLNEGETRDFCEKYKFTREEKESIITTRIEAKRIIKKLKTPQDLLPSFIYEILSSLSQETLLFTTAKAEEKIVKKRIFFYFTRLKKLKIEIDGNDLKKMGYKPSPLFKKILEEVKKAKLNGQIKTKEEEINYVRKRF